MSKKFEEKTKLGQFLTKATSKGVNVVSAILKAKDGDFVGAYEEAKKVLNKSENIESDNLLSELIKKKTEFRSDYDKYLEDVKDARSMYETASKTQSNKIADIVIKYNLPIIGILVLINIIAVFQLRQYQGMVAIVSNFIGITISQLFNERQSVINFFFGSSQGSKDKSIRLNE